LTPKVLFWEKHFTNSKFGAKYLFLQKFLSEHIARVQVFHILQKKSRFAAQEVPKTGHCDPKRGIVGGKTVKFSKCGSKIFIRKKSGPGAGSPQKMLQNHILKHIQQDNHITNQHPSTNDPSIQAKS